MHRLVQVIMDMIKGYIFQWLKAIWLLALHFWQFTRWHSSNLPANGGDTRDVGLIPGSERSPREGNDNPLQYSCLENPMDRGTWRDTAQGVEKGQSDATEHASTHTHLEIKIPSLFSLSKLQSIFFIVSRNDQH